MTSLVCFYQLCNKQLTSVFVHFVFRRDLNEGCRDSHFEWHESDHCETGWRVQTDRCYGVRSAKNHLCNWANWMKNVLWSDDMNKNNISIVRVKNVIGWLLKSPLGCWKHLKSQIPYAERGSQASCFISYEWARSFEMYAPFLFSLSLCVLFSVLLQSSLSLTEWLLFFTLSNLPNQNANELEFERKIHTAKEKIKTIIKF